jgi:hypothetical protein
VSIYVECKPTASGKHHHPPAKKHPSAGTTTTATTPYVQPYVQPTRVTHPRVHPHHHGATHKKTAQHRTDKPQVVHPKLTQLSAPRAAGLGSAFDLGSGPTILLVLLLGSVLAVLGVGGARSWRNRHRV